MRMRRPLTRALISVAASSACLALATPAVAAAADPPGANGTVKIDGPAYQLDNRNEPHVTCEFQVEFFNFDKDERATIILSAQPPSSRDFHEVKRLEDQLVSKDAATGGAYTRDPDEVFKFSVNDLDLADADMHPKQGYHIKLTVDRKNHPEWTEKHKVFWVKPCAQTSTPSTPPTSPGTPPGNGGGGGGGVNGGPGMPITGVAASGIAVLGLALIGAGVAMVVLRRRRDNVTFTA